MIDKTIYSIDDETNLVGKIVLLKAWQILYKKETTLRHLIRRVVGQDLLYIEMQPLYFNGSHTIERLHKGSIEGIISIDYAEQLLMWEELNRAN